ALAPCLANSPSNTCDVDDRAAFETFEIRIARKYLFRLFVGGFEIFIGFDGPGDTLDLWIPLTRAIICSSDPSHMAASRQVADEGDILASSTHAGCELIHQVRAEDEVVECLNIDVCVHLVASLVRDHLNSSFPSLL